MGMILSQIPKIERLIGDSIFGIVEVDTGSLSRHPLTTLWIIVEKLPQMQLCHGFVMRLKSRPSRRLVCCLVPHL